MNLSDDELDLLLAGLFELALAHAENDQIRERAKAVAVRLGGDPDAMFYGGRVPGRPS